MKEKKSTASAEAEKAIQQVLQAERDAERAIHNCENDAQLIIHDAQNRAQDISARADQRITNIEMRHSHKLNQLIKDIEGEGAVKLRFDASQDYDMDRLQTMVKTMAVELCRAGSLSEDDPETDQ